MMVPLAVHAPALEPPNSSLVAAHILLRALITSDDCQMFLLVPSVYVVGCQEER